MSALRLGDIAPDFEAVTQEGPISFHKWMGDSWTMLMSHPADYTPVCTTELGAVARYKPEFDKRNVKLIAVSCDPVESHNGWIGDINETQKCTVNFPIIADPERKVARLYGMIGYHDDMPKDKQPNPALTVRCVFIIDPTKTVRLILVYPASCGRNFDEIIRVIDSLQITTYKKCTTPANWKPGDDVIISPAVKDEEAKTLFGDFTKLKPYLRLTKDPSLPK